MVILINAPLLSLKLDDRDIEDDHESLRELVVHLKKDDAVIEPGIIKIFEE